MTELPRFEPPPDDLEGVTKAVASGRLVMWCESPDLRGGAVVDGYLTIRGWSFAASGVRDVLVYVDGKPRRAQAGVGRPDLEELFGPALAQAGFALTVELDPNCAGSADVAVVARGHEDQAVGMRGEITCRRLGRTAGSSAASADAPSGRTTDEEHERFVPDRLSGTLMEAEHLARYRWAADVAPGRQVLDAGCGVGYGSWLLAQAGATAVTGVDIAEEALHAARAGSPAGCEFVRGDLQALPLPSDAFDLVVCFETIEHVTDWDRALDELRRVLRPDGTLLISSPNRGVYEPGNPFHIHEFTPGELYDALRGRFAQVRLLRQQSYYFSLVCDDEIFSRAALAQDVQMRLRKLDGAAPGTELYTLAVAGDASLPQLSSLGLIGAAFDPRGWHDLAFSWHARVRDAEARVAQTAAALAEAEAALKRLSDPKPGAGST